MPAWLAPLGPTWWAWEVCWWCRVSGGKSDKRIQPAGPVVVKESVSGDSRPGCRAGGEGQVTRGRGERREEELYTEENVWKCFYFLKSFSYVFSPLIDEFTDVFLVFDIIFTF